MVFKKEEALIMPRDSMNILLMNTYDTTGGAAVACRRLLHALNQNGTTASLLVQQRDSNDPDVVSTTHSKIKEVENFFRFAWERFLFYRKERSRDVRFAFSLGNTGEDITRHPLVRQADVLHLHWFNRGFLSLRSIERLAQMKKPMVWTLHDMWMFTGGCHYAGTCGRYRTECGECPFLKKPGVHDLSSKVFQAKAKLLKTLDPKKTTFVACSQWLAETARGSSLLKRFDVVSIPNPIDLSVYRPAGKESARKTLGLPVEKKLVLFGAGNLFDQRKGLKYLADALGIISAQHPEWKERIDLVVFGKSKQPLDGIFPFPVHEMGMLADEQRIALLYAACDLFALPSLEDNLPNTVMESLACGTPVAAFRIGGIPEMIEHRQNGFIAEPRSAEDLAEGILSVLSAGTPEALQNAAREKAERSYSPSIVAGQYSSFYAKLLGAKPL
jgi:glycosyltransferase involved in cell wall biosynthesis